MAISLTTPLSDCYVECEGKHIDLHKCILYARAPALRDLLMNTGQKLDLFKDCKYDDVMFAVNCIYDNRVCAATGVTNNRIHILQMLGNGDLITQAISLYSPTMDDIEAYPNNTIEERYKDRYDDRIMGKLLTLMNTKSENRSVIFRMPADILKKTFPIAAFTVESASYIRAECTKYVNAMLKSDPQSMTIPSAYVYFMSLFL